MTELHEAAKLDSSFYHRALKYVTGSDYSKDDSLWEILKTVKEGKHRKLAMILVWRLKSHDERSLCN